jgi:FkbM family methyltransferase
MNAVMRLVRPIYVRLPAGWRFALKAALARWQIARGTFRGEETEWERLHEWLGTGDWVIDVGANMGMYTARMSELVGPTGRVIAFEPAPESFSLLARNARHFAYPNTTLLNLAVSETPAEVGFDVPPWGDGTPNYYVAHISPTGSFRVLAVPIDSLSLAGPVRLVKIDVEGHEAAVLRGMWELLKRDLPVVVFEKQADARRLLESLGYQVSDHGNTPNFVAVHPESAFPRSGTLRGARVG